MKAFSALIALFLGAITSLAISTVNAGGCNSYTEKKAEIECSSDAKKCVDNKEKELLYKVEA